jgi:hypothetical protein
MKDAPGCFQLRLPEDEIIFVALWHTFGGGIN